MHLGGLSCFALVQDAANTSGMETGRGETILSSAGFVLGETIAGLVEKIPGVDFTIKGVH